MSTANADPDRPLVLIVDEDEKVRSVLRAHMLSVGIDIRMPGSRSLDIQHELTSSMNPQCRQEALS
jgi:FixJ family two-component response regulator